MKYCVDSEIVCQADQCSVGHSCQKVDDSEFCKVASKIREGVLVVYCIDRPDCNYRSSQLDVAVCNCPVRNEIYSRYGL